MTNDNLTTKIAKWSLRKDKINQERTRIYLRRHIKVYPGDNWAPNIDKDKVRVALHIVFEKNIYSNVSIWGNDDTGVEKEFGENISDAIEMYLRIASNTCPPYSKLIDPDGKWKFKRA
jgi:hypothetical protein